MRILIVEDDKIIGDAILQGLGPDGHAVDWVQSQHQALAALSAQHYDLLLLDLGLPDGSGLDILKDLRNKKDGIPVLILTAYDAIKDKIKGLDCGADDYLIKPFDLDELRARIRALWRRSSGNAVPILTSGDISLNPATRVVTHKGQIVNLGTKEFAILRRLMERPGWVFSKTQIEDSLYGWGMEVESNTVEVHIHGIRKKLGNECIQTVRYVGYKVNT